MALVAIYIVQRLVLVLINVNEVPKNWMATVLNWMAAAITETGEKGS